MNIRRYIKQLFCEHLYEVVAEKNLGRLKEKNSEYSIYYTTYNIYAQRKRCVKCGKRIIEEKRTIVV